MRRTNPGFDRSLAVNPQPDAGLSASAAAPKLETAGSRTRQNQRRALTELRRKARVQGFDALHESELLALLVPRLAHGTASASSAAQLLLDSGGLPGLRHLSPARLAQVHALTVADATRIVAALELGRRDLQSELGGQRPVCGSFEAVVSWASPRLGPLAYEEFWVLGLDARNGLTTLRCVARGGQHGCALTARDVLRPALMDGASAIVVVHNHPSGDATPSSEDVQMTRALAAACDVVSMPLLDHVIVSCSQATSLLELGLLT